jgi:hypothetical protein
LLTFGKTFVSRRSSSPAREKNVSSTVVLSMTSSWFCALSNPSENVLSIRCVGVLRGFDGAVAMRGGDDGPPGLSSVPTHTYTRHIQ